MDYQCRLVSLGISSTALDATALAPVSNVLTLRTAREPSSVSTGTQQCQRGNQAVPRREPSSARTATQQSQHKNPAVLWSSVGTGTQQCQHEAPAVLILELCQHEAPTVLTLEQCRHEAPEHC